MIGTIGEVASGDDDTADDGVAYTGPPPPISERTWRHPAEYALGARRDRRRRRNRRLLGLAVGSAVGGGLFLTLTLGGETTSPTDAAPLATADPDPPELDPTTGWAHDVTVDARSSMVTVHHGSASTTIAHAVAIGREGFLITSRRALGDGTTFVVHTQAGTSHTAELVGGDATTDIAVLAIDATVPMALTATEAPAPGDQVAVVEDTTGARADAVARDTMIAEADDGEPLVGLFSLTVSKGDTIAGSPIVDGDGAIVGIAAHTSSDHAAAGVPIDVVARVADEIIDSGRVSHAWLGVSLTDVGPAVVTDVAADGPAAGAGIAIGDLIKAVEGVKVDDAAALVAALLVLEPGHRVQLAVDRDGEALTLWFDLGARHTGG